MPLYPLPTYPCFDDFMAFSTYNATLRPYTSFSCVSDFKSFMLQLLISANGSFELHLSLALYNIYGSNVGVLHPDTVNWTVGVGMNKLRHAAHQ